ncbi:hypothetical protein ACQ4PT_011265 [Festuca glaucescens]
MAPSCWLFWAWWLPLMLAIVVAEEQPEGCSATSCGNLTISDPFWLSDWQTGRSCGSPDFKITCLNNTPVLPSSIPIVGFTIMDISYEEESLRVVDVCKLTLLQASNSCQVTVWNTSDKLGIPFKIDPINLNLVMYNCTAAAVARRDGELEQTRMRCGNESHVFVRMEGSYDETSAMEGCNTLVVVPVLGGANGKANTSDYEQLIGGGFLLKWWRAPVNGSKRAFTKIMLIEDDGFQACDVTSEIEEMAKKMTFIGLWCIQILPIYRPTIAKVLEMFERSLDEMEMPPKQNFCELLEDSAQNMSVQSASSTIPEDMSLVNSKSLEELPSH